MPSNDGGLGDHLVGDKIPVGERNLQVVKLLGEGECSIGMLTLSLKKKRLTSFVLSFNQADFLMSISWILMMPVEIKSHN